MERQIWLTVAAMCAGWLAGYATARVLRWRR